MRILFVATDYPERGEPATGFPNYLFRVSRSLIQMGHEATILAAGRWNDHRVEQGINIWIVQVEYMYCKSQALNYVINALHKGYILNQKIKELVKERGIDVIQFTSLEGIAFFYKSDIPAVLRLSSYAKIAFTTFDTCSRAKVKAMTLMERIASRKCCSVFAPCKNTAQAFGKDCRRKINVIETPFINDVQEYDVEYLNKHLQGKQYVLFFGSLYAEKGIWVIAEILERFLKKNSKYYFVFVGNAYNADFVQLLKKRAGECKNRVFIWEALPHKKLYPIIMNADFVVLPSLMENLSNACIEAMYFEKVVIGTDGASFEQLIVHGKNGFLCKIGDSEDLLEKMQIAVDMGKNQKIKMGKMAKARIDKLQPQYTVKKLLRLYNYVIVNSKFNKK